MTNSDSIFRKLFKGGGIVAVGLVFELGTSFVAKLIIARLFRPVEYGELSIGITLMAMVSTLTLLGLNVGVGRYLPRFDDPGKRRGVLVSGFVLSVTTSLVVSVLLAASAPLVARVVFGDPELADVLFIFALIIPFAAIMKMAVGSMQGTQESLPKVYIQHLSLPGLRFLAIAIVLLLGAELLGVAWAYAFSYIATALLGLYFVATRTTLFSFDIPYEPAYRRLLSFSAPLIVSTAMALVFADIDMFMLGMFQTAAEVGVYNVIYPLAQLLLISLSGFGFLFMPVLSELHSQGEEDKMRRMYEVVTKWITLATLPLFVVMVLFPTTVISLTFGSKYATGATGLAVLATGFFSHVLAGFNNSTLTSIGRTQQIMYANTTTAAVNVVLNLLLIPRYGILGAAVATTVAYVVLNLTLSYQLYELSGIHPFSRRLVLPVLTGVVLAVTCYGAVTLLIADSLLRLLSFVVIFGGAYPIAVLRLGGIEREEVMLILSFEERFGVDLGPFKSFAKRVMG